MEGCRRRSRSVPAEETRGLKVMPSISSSASHAATEGLDEGLLSAGQSSVSAALAIEQWPLWTQKSTVRMRLLQTEVGFPECPVCQPASRILRHQ